MVLLSGSLINIQKICLRSFFLIQSKFSRLKQVSSLLQNQLSIQQKLYNHRIRIQSIMNKQNPFITSSRPPSFIHQLSRIHSKDKQNYRPKSSSHHYFTNNDYQGSYANDRYLDQFKSKVEKEKMYSRVFGLSALRYDPQCYSGRQEYCSEYYGGQTTREMMDNKTPIYSDYVYENSEINNSKLEQSKADRNMHRSMKNTLDMFGSEYFQSKMQSKIQSKLMRKHSQIQEREKPCIKKKSTILRKQTFSSEKSKNSKIQTFLRLDEIRDEAQQSNDMLIMQDEDRNDDPKTLYVRTKRKMFYLYTNPNRTNY